MSPDWRQGFLWPLWAQLLPSLLFPLLTCSNPVSLGHERLGLGTSSLRP